MLTHTDENTGRTIRQLTCAPNGAQVGYFRLQRRLPDGRLVIDAKHETGSLMALDPGSGDLQPIAHPPLGLMRLHEADGLAWFWDATKRELWEQVLPEGEARLVAAGSRSYDADDDAPPGDVHDITCDGRTFIGVTAECEPSDINDIFSGDFRRFWRWVYRKRSATLWAQDVASGARTELVQLPEYNVQHIDTSPTDPGLFKYAQDGAAVFDQRAHAVRTDGSEWRFIRPQAPGEWVHHEFWWPATTPSSHGELIGYKYMDRRGDPSIHEHPWGEYAPRPLQLGIANLAGNEVYLSDPLAHYHSHLNVSPDARIVTGEGTHDYSFACAAPFDMSRTRLDLQPLATIHTPYVPASAQGVECCVSSDGRWLLFNDTIEGVKQVCAVELDF